MTYLIGLLPLLLFVVLFVGSGIYFTVIGVANAFYQISPVTAIIPAIALAWVLDRDGTTSKLNQFLDGVRHRDIITMCIVFLQAGAFNEVTKDIGSIESTTQCVLNLMPVHLVLVGIFIIAAFVSTAIGTAIGTIAAIAPIATSLSAQFGLSPVIYTATVISGAMFGDNLSLIASSTIAAVASQEANSKKKFRFNALIALIALCITMLLLLLYGGGNAILETKPCSLMLVVPYLLLFGLAMCGMNVFAVLFLSIVAAGVIGMCTHHNYGILAFGHSLDRGFASMHEIVLLSLLVGGLSGLTGRYFTEHLAHYLSCWIRKKNRVRKQVLAQFVISGLATVFTLLFANNTIAIIFSGAIASKVAEENKIPPHMSAVWLDIFSSIFQGIIPYGAPVLLASTIAGVSPLSIIPHVYYCYVLGIVSVFYILFFDLRGATHNASE